MVVLNHSAAAKRSTGPREGWRYFCRWLPGLVWAVLALTFSESRAEAQVSREYQLKAVFLYNFAQFTEWPENAFAAPNAPIVIAVLGANPFEGLLEDTVRGETVHGHPLAVAHYHRADEIKACHILFISQSETRHMDDIMKSVRGKPVLTVADADGALSREAIIRFLVENNKVRFRINQQAARAADITLSSRLLRVADAVPGGAP